MNSLLGRLLRLNADGSIPEDNPFYTKATGKYPRATWALGMRNPYTFAVQAETGRLFINDVGGVAEEINEGGAGANYGWPTVEHGPTKDPALPRPDLSLPQPPASSAPPSRPRIFPGPRRTAASISSATSTTAGSRRSIPRPPPPRSHSPRACAARSICASRRMAASMSCCATRG